MNNKDFIKKYGLSRDVISETASLTDWDKATIIWNSDFPLSHRLKALKELKTCDDKLKQQIQERIDYDERVISTFKQLQDGCIYSLTLLEPEEYPIGHYVNFNLAFEDGCRSESDF